LDEHIWAQINTAIGKEATPEDIFDYIYGVLHSPAYRAKYKEFLKVDFPRIPYPKDQTEFEHYKDCGHQLRELHLMHNVPESAVTFTQEGSMVVEQVRRDGDRVYINDTQYFDNVPQTAWEFYIGGYQPAQKWLKDRKGRALSYDDKDHYRQIITVLLETKRIMDSIDN
jgi:predicted helicase